MLRKSPLRRALLRGRVIVVLVIAAALIGFAIGRLSAADCGEALTWASSVSATAVAP